MGQEFDFTNFVVHFSNMHTIFNSFIDFYLKNSARDYWMSFEQPTKIEYHCLLLFNM